MRPIQAAGKSIKLCLVSPDFFPTRGGAELRFRRYLSGFKKRGICPQILSGTPVARKLSAADLQSPWYQEPVGRITLEANLDGTPIRQIRLPDSDASKRSMILNQHLLQSCEQSPERPDVVQFLSVLPATTGVCLKKLRRLGIPSAFAYTLPGKKPLNPLKHIARRMAFRRLCHKLDCIVTGSTVTRKLLLKMGIKTRIEVIPNGVDLKRFRALQNPHERRQLREALGMDPGASVILFIGAIHPRKGCDLLLEAWISLASRFPEAHLYLIGMRHDLNAPKLSDFKHRVDSLIRASNAGERVHFPGYIENVDDYLRAADLLVFPSRREGMPNAVLEAMASGLPCVLTPFVGLSADFGQPGREYLLVDHDSSALNTAVAQLIKDHELRRKLGSCGRAWVERTMDLEAVLDRYAALYQNMAGP